MKQTPSDTKLLSAKFTSDILEALSKQNKPQSAYDLLESLRDKGAKAPMQIYRALEKLETAGLIHKLPKSNSWIACDGHSHNAPKDMFVILSCTSCGSATEIEDATIAKALDNISDRQSFDMPSQTIEVDGVCQPCKDKDQ